VDEVRSLLRARGRGKTQWEVGSRAEPLDLVELLLARGLVPDKDPYAVALVLTEAPPPPAPGIVARRVETSRGTRPGQVLGYVGDTGDAFETPFQLHFEIHPRSLLSLRYDGAVDPTTYLEHWQRLSHVRGSRPLHPALPTGTARTQA
jgi:hypothetical protein